MKKRLIKILVLLPVIIAALAVVAAVSLQVFLGTETAGNLIRKHLNNAIPGHVNWETQQVSIFTGKIRLSGLEIMDPEKQKIIVLNELSVDIGLAELVSGTVLVESARILQPEIYLEANQEEGLNIVKAFASGDKKVGQKEKEEEEKKGVPELDIHINRLEIENGIFSFNSFGHEPGPEQHVFFDDFNIRVTDADLARRAGRLSFSVNSGTARAFGMNVPIDGFFLETTLKQEKLDPLKLEFETGRSSLAVSGSVSDIFTKPVPDLHVNALADLSEIRRIFSIQQDLSGTAQLTASLQGSPENPEISAELASDGCSIAGTDLRELILKTRMQDKKLDILHFQAGPGPSGTVGASGTIDLESVFPEGLMSAPRNPETMACSFEIVPENFLFSEIPGMKDFRGSLSGNIGVESSGVSLENIEADVDAELSVQGISPGKKPGPFDIDISALAGMEKGVVYIEQINAEAPEFLLHAQGSYNIFENSLELKTTADVADTGQLAQKAGISGITGKKAMLTADISGNASRPSVDAALRAESPGFMNNEIDSLEAETEFSGGRLDLSGVKLTSGSSVIEMSGAMQILDSKTFLPEADPVIDLAFSTNNMHLSDFLPEIKGSLKVSGNIGGSLKNPDGMITAEAGDIETGIQKIKRLHVKSTIQDRRIYLQPLEVFLAEDQELTAGGWVSMDRKYQLSINSSPLDLALIEPLEHTGLRGNAEISAQGSGRLDAPGLEALIRLSDLSAKGGQIPAMDIRAAIKDTTASVSISKPFSLNAVYNFADRGFSVEAELLETELAPFLAFAGIDGFSGSFSGSLKADGNTENIGNISADLNISDFDLLMEQEEIASFKNFAASFENRKITIPENRINLLENGYIDISGTADLGGNLEILAKGAIPAKLADRISPEIHDPQGRAVLDGRIGGTVENPEFSAQITPEDLGCTLASTAQRLHSVNGRIVVTEDAVTVSDLAGGLDQGEFSLNGSVDLRDFAPVRADMDIKANSLALSVPDMMEMKVNAELKLTGTPDESLLSGEIMLLEGLYFRDVNLSLVERAGDIGTRKRGSAPVSQIELPDLPFLKNLILDISLGHKNPFMVDNNLALLAIRPQLDLGGTPENPVLTGRAEVTEGTVAYRDTEFEIKKGVIDFVDPYSIEPEMDIRAESKVRKWTITLAITGVPGNLDFQLSSSPHEEDEDIVSLLATGKTTREMAGSGGGGLGPEQLLADMLSERLEKRLKEETGLDIVEVEYEQNGDGTESDNGVRVTVGKELSRRLTVKYGVERKSGEMVRQTTGIYRLLENLTANAYHDNEGSFGGEMRYRLEFR